MDLKPHKFGTIGLKKLFLADTGLTEKSNQNHIGLFDLLSAKLSGIRSQHTFDPLTVKYDRVITTLQSIINIT